MLLRRHSTMKFIVAGPNDGGSSIVGRNEWVQAMSDILGVELQGLGISLSTSILIPMRWDTRSLILQDQKLHHFGIT